MLSTNSKEVKGTPTPTHTIQDGEITPTSYGLIKEGYKMPTKDLGNPHLVFNK